MSCLHRLALLNTRLDVLPLSFTPSRLSPQRGLNECSAQLVHQWIADGMYVHCGNRDERTQPSAACQQTALGQKGHLWLVLSVIYQLIAGCPNEVIRKQAVEISQLFNMQAIVSDYMHLLSQKNQKSSL